jgi:hypothetical protein
VRSFVSDFGEDNEVDYLGIDFVEVEGENGERVEGKDNENPEEGGIVEIGVESNKDLVDNKDCGERRVEFGLKFEEGRRKRRKKRRRKRRKKRREERRKRKKRRKRMREGSGW